MARGPRHCASLYREVRPALTRSPTLVVSHEPWPELPWREWGATLSTLHMWVQIVGKVRLALAPPQAHWWHIPLYLSSRGLTTSPIPYGHRHFQVDFDFVDHQLRGLGIEVRISTRPVEVVESIPFETDEQHASYDPRQAGSLWRAMLQADRVMKVFQSGFVGKASPVHLFWGGFDLATARYSGRMAPLHPGGIPNSPDWVMQEAASREESNCGWWPLSEEPGPSFFSYTSPEPDGFRSATVRPAEAFFDERFRDFVLPYDAVRGLADPDAAVLEFFESTYEAGADLGGWDRSALEPAVRPDRPPRRAWSTPPDHVEES